MKVAIVLGLLVYVVNVKSFINPHEIDEQEWTLFKVC